MAEEAEKEPAELVQPHRDESPAAQIAPASHMRRPHRGEMQGFAKVGQKLTTREAADRLKISVSKLEKWRAEEGGPPFERLGGSIRYDEDRVDAWARERSSAKTEATPMEIAQREREKAGDVADLQRGVVADLAHQRAELVQKLTGKRDERSALAAAAARGEETDVLGRVAAIDGEIQTFERHLAFFDEHVAPPAQERLNGAEAAEAEAVRRLRYEHAGELVRAGAARVAREYTDLRAKLMALVATIAEAERWVDAVNGELPAGAEPLEKPEDSVRDWPGLARQELGREKVWRWVWPSGDALSESQAVAVVRTGPRSGSVETGTAAKLVPNRTVREALFWKIRHRPAAPRVVGARLRDLRLPELAPEEPYAFVAGERVPASAREEVEYLPYEDEAPRDDLTLAAGALKFGGWLPPEPSQPRPPQED
ncbi:MAG: helix-turn-helix domain-containing protein [Caulobacterales bacterium]